MSDEDIVLYEVDEHVATITLNRPRQRNALLIETLERLGQIWNEIDRNPDVRVAILTGSDRGNQWIRTGRRTDACPELRYSSSGQERSAWHY